MPYRPLNAGKLAREVSVSDALHWLLQLGDHVAPIPGTSDSRHLDGIVLATAGVSEPV
ncbi:hypothetical protein OHA27_10870 [Streptomyces sp. NBC_01619]|uniref:hypothetical protein n=1 Tax=Streptomyces sp. NBC_01619 TaxID=2975901 RepID=UPI002254AF44|nr:hypothetical protein [Streptomyces sp. NBC_01619]MCX4510798.1 hypothetical protein [Streptomyces sp. NBC_01619]